MTPAATNGMDANGAEASEEGRFQQDPTTTAPCRKKVRLEETVNDETVPEQSTRLCMLASSSTNDETNRRMLVVTPKTASCHKLKSGITHSATALTRVVTSTTNTPFAAVSNSAASSSSSASSTKQADPSTTEKDDTVDVLKLAKSEKRTDYLSWDDYFIALVKLSGRTCRGGSDEGQERTTAAGGVCIVDNATHRILAIGQPDTTTVEESGTDGSCSCCAALSAASCWWRNHPVAAAEGTGGARLYTYDLPCVTCTDTILLEQQQLELSQSSSASTPSLTSSFGGSPSTRIQQVVYQVDSSSSDPDATNKILDMFAQGQVQVRQYKPSSSRSTIDIDFYDERDADGQKRQQDTVQSETETARSEEEGNTETKIQGQSKESVLVPSRPIPSRFLSFDDYCMAVSLLTAKRSKDPNTQVGACIVDDVQKQIVGIGYNGFPIGCSDDHLPWAREGETKLHTKYLYVCHAEVNAVLNKCGGGAPASSSSLTLYAALFPCNDCAKIIIQSGIRQVVYTSDRYHDTDACRASRILFRMAGVKLRQYVPTFPSVRISLLDEE